MLGADEEEVENERKATEKAKAVKRWLTLARRGVITPRAKERNMMATWFTLTSSCSAIAYFAVFVVEIISVLNHCVKQARRGD